MYWNDVESATNGMGDARLIETWDVLKFFSRFIFVSFRID